MDSLMESNQMLFAGGLMCLAGGAALVNKAMMSMRRRNNNLALPLVAPKFVTATPMTGARTGSRVAVSRATKDDVAVGDDKFDVTKMPGTLPPVGFWDPLKLSNGKTERRMRWFRECEIKHGRVSMLAALGFIVQESFHPLFGGNIDVPSAFAFQQTPLENFWGPVVLVLAAFESQAVNTVQAPSNAGFGVLQEDHELGDFGFDPMGFKPALDDAGMRDKKNKELQNGRLAMLGIAGMVAQELVTGQKIFGSPVSAAEVDNIHQIAAEMSDMLNATAHL